MIIEHSTTEAWLLAPVRCTSLVCLCGWVRCSMWLLLPAWARDYLGDNSRESRDSTRVAEWFRFDRLLRTEVNTAQECGAWLYEFVDVNNPLLRMLKLWALLHPEWVRLFHLMSLTCGIMDTLPWYCRCHSRARCMSLWVCDVSHTNLESRGRLMIGRCLEILRLWWHTECCSLVARGIHFPCLALLKAYGAVL